MAKPRRPEKKRQKAKAGTTSAPPGMPPPLPPWPIRFFTMRSIVEIAVQMSSQSGPRVFNCAPRQPRCEPATPDRDSGHLCRVADVVQSV